MPVLILTTERKPANQRLSQIFITTTGVYRLDANLFRNFVLLPPVYDAGMPGVWQTGVIELQPALLVITMCTVCCW